MALPCHLSLPCVCTDFVVGGLWSDRDLTWSVVESGTRLLLRGIIHGKTAF